MTGGATGIRILGPVEVWRDGVQVDIGHRRARLLLGVLVLWSDQAVSLDRLVDLTWPDTDPPRSAHNAIHVALSRLRVALAGVATIDRIGDGYRLDIAVDRTDLGRFRAATAAARRADGATRVECLRAAEAEWRGPELAGEMGADLRDRIFAGLREQRLAAIEERVAAELDLGRHHRLVPELVDLVGTYPTRELLVRHLMLALHRDGQAARALDVSRGFARSLAEDLGLDPGPQLRALEAAILRNASALAPPGRATGSHQLPRDGYGFVGRGAELALLDTALAAVATEPRALFLAAISGGAGTGKTTLAVHWAHRVADRYPDGQLYLDLRGYDGRHAPLGVAAALRRLLVGVDAGDGTLPTDVDELAARYRTALTGRRLLIVLDNARDQAHVRPLLPGTPGCGVVVTSRRRLAGLAAADGAHTVVLAPFDRAESVAFLTRRLGAARVSAEPDAVAGIVGSCAGLPLALAIVAARAAERPDFGLDGYATQLASPRCDLGSLTAGDATTDVRAVFSWSYHALPAPAARMFRLLGIHPGPHVTVPSAASLAAIPEDAAARQLAELSALHLVGEPVPGRYEMHGLLRAFAAELADAAEADAALARLFDHYTHTALAAGKVLYPHRRLIELPEPATGAVVVPLADRDAALAWLHGEYRTLLGAVGSAADRGHDRAAWHLVWCLTEFLHRQGLWIEWQAVQSAVVVAAGRLGDDTVLAAAQRGHGRVLSLLHRFDEASDLLRDALEVSRRCGDDIGEAAAYQILAELGTLAESAGAAAADVPAALGRALAIYRRLGLVPAYAATLNNIAFYQANHDDCDAALRNCQDALAIVRELGDRNAEAATMDTLGLTYRRMGDHEAAVRVVAESVALQHELGQTYAEALALTNLGDCYLAAGRADDALDAWHRAIEQFDRLGIPDGDDLRQRLTAHRG